MIKEIEILSSQKINKRYIDNSEYPNPIFRRSGYRLLDGIWEFQFDPDDIGVREKWYQKFPMTFEEIEVPYVYQSKKSRIFRNTQSKKNDIIWYNKKFCVDQKKDRVELNFGAVDYHSQVYVNGMYVGQHKGGFTPFKFDVSSFLQKGENTLSLRVVDFLYKEDIHRGKQFWDENPKSIWYTPSTGIWQSVWLEEMSTTHIKKFKIWSDLDKGCLEFEIMNNLLDLGSHKLMLDIMLDNKKVSSLEIIAKKVNRFSVNILGDQVFNYNYHMPGLVWSPENPVIFDVIMKLVDIKTENVEDSVETYTAMRKIHVDKGLIYLNNRPYYQRLVLDQGYWPESLMTGSSFEHLKDILLAKEMGFNGARKHEKIESSHYYYWADMMGFLVWGEMPSASMYSDEMVSQSFQEWYEALNKCFNHPSIVAWVPLNESWGVYNLVNDKKQLNYALSLYHYLKSYDETRLIINNDGWEMSKTDIIGIHNYSHGLPNEEKKRMFYKSLFQDKTKFLKHLPSNRNIFLNTYEKENMNKPILLSEFGGISLIDNTKGDWAYSHVATKELYLEELQDLMTTVIESPFIQGFCYTQLYDVEKEKNGLLTYSRDYKVETSKLKKMFQEEKFYLSQEIF